VGWQGLDIAQIVPSEQIAWAHELVEHPEKLGRIIVFDYIGVLRQIAFVALL
jgi:hypothetical protein